VYTIAISDDKEGGIVFLHRVTPGCAERSYGVHVAKLAGMPGSIVLRAEDVLKQLESQKTIVKPEGVVEDPQYVLYASNGHSNGAQVYEAGGRYEWQSEEAKQAALALELAEKGEVDLESIDVCAITPLDALNLLFLLQKKRSKARR
jgi:DNA mismatch repair protein MutS